MQDVIELIKVIAAVALPFILYILHGIRQSIHDLRDSVAPLPAKIAVLEAVGNERRGVLEVLQRTLNRL